MGTYSERFFCSERFFLRETWGGDILPLRLAKLAIRRSHMSEAQSVIGYVPDAVAKELQAGRGLGKEVLELPLDPAKNAAHIRVKHSDIAEVRVGPSTSGHTSLQLILKPEATYELFGIKSSGVLTAIQDPSYWYGLGRLKWFVIYVGPILRPTAQVGGFQLVK